MAYAKLSDAECSAIHIARAYAPTDARKTMKREIFSRAKVAFGIPANHKLLCDVDVNEPNHGVLKNKATREPYELNVEGKWIGAQNGANAVLKWFKVDAIDLHDAIIEHLDNELDGEIEWMAHEPAGHKFTVSKFGTDRRICVQANGDTYIELAADAYETEQQEEDDDLPY